MVWSNVPGANIHRGAEGDNTLQRAKLAGIKRNTHPSSQPALMQSRQPSQTQPTAVAHHSSRHTGSTRTMFCSMCDSKTFLFFYRVDNLNCSAQYLGTDKPGVLKVCSSICVAPLISRKLVQAAFTACIQTKSIGDNTTVRFNNHYCPELGAAIALGTCCTLTTNALLSLAIVHQLDRQQQTCVRTQYVHFASLLCDANTGYRSQMHMSAVLAACMYDVGA
jgi:hypothetical protein